MLQTAEGEGQCSVTHFSALRLHLAQKEALRGDHSKRRGIHSGGILGFPQQQKPLYSEEQHSKVGLFDISNLS